MGLRSTVGIERVAETGKQLDAGLVTKNVFAAVAVVDIEIDECDAGQSMLGQGVMNTDGPSLRSTVP